MLGLDIGGAHLKASDGESRSCSVPFALWQHPARLAPALAELMNKFADDGPLAVTMTGELADCFQTREEGVQAILDAVQQAAGGRDIAVWQTGGEFCTVDEARQLAPLVAAANWHGLATWAARIAPEGPGLLIDLGSTTCDLIPLCNGYPQPAATTDRGRLASGELIYLGVRRTPLCALRHSVLLGGQEHGLASELFATTLDLFLLSGEIAENPDDLQTANGRPATRDAAVDRITRMLCDDRDGLTAAHTDELALQFRAALADRLKNAMVRILARLDSPPQSVLLSGEGEFLLRPLLAEASDVPAERVVSLASLLGCEHSRAACAFALSRLGRERW